MDHEKKGKINIDSINNFFDSIFIIQSKMILKKACFKFFKMKIKSKETLTLFI